MGYCYGTLSAKTRMMQAEMEGMQYQAAMFTQQIGSARQTEPTDQESKPVKLSHHFNLMTHLPIERFIFGS